MSGYSNTTNVRTSLENLSYGRGFCDLTYNYVSLLHMVAATFPSHECIHFEIEKLD